MQHAAANGITICYDTAGPPDGPAVLLIMGLGSQMVSWPPVLIEGLAAAGRRVIWYDNRDVGESTWLDDRRPAPLSDLLAGVAAGRVPDPPYRLDDMAADAVGLLDHLRITAADVVGVSMGGMIAQRMAIGFPERVRSLTSVMSTTGARGLPGPTAAASEALFAPSPTDRDGYIAASRAKRAVLGSPGFDVDEEWQTATIMASFDRGLNPAGFLRQYHAILADGDRTAQLGQLGMPTLVVHGSDDPLIPLSAGRATAEAIPGAVLEVIGGMGHDLPPAVCDRLVALLVAERV